MSADTLPEVIKDVKLPPKALSKSKLPVCRQVENPDWMPIFAARGAIQAGTTTWRMGQCFILLLPPATQEGWRRSIASKLHFQNHSEGEKKQYLA